jgi:hypothetical protein
MSHKKALQEITVKLLEATDDFGLLHQATDDLYRLFQTVSSVDWQNDKHSTAILLASGKAIGPAWAAMCVKDTYRTIKFLRGLMLAIQQMQQKRGRKPVHVLYAGTGPFATLALPLTTIFRPEEVQFTFLEINPESVLSLQKVINIFEAEAYVRSVVQGDAATYQSAPDQLVDIVVVEAMLPALQDEPQVAITMNLAPQLAVDGIFIPQCIRVHAGLLHPKKNTDRMMGLEHSVTDHYILLNEVFECSQPPAAPWAEMSPLEVFPEVPVIFPPDIPAGYQQLCLFTSIQVFESEQLEYWQCHLTQPHPVGMLDLAQQVSFRYCLGEKPGFECKRLSGEY